ncbi:hypothetical protein M441DRAFT_46108 [Trichoderma asperellum CBS 433.97]|uniref:Uncharacterized protein n=1 Tax=Trichoderma asperellum (strain ATCC 204424 / CBS 433.97 / NBRC 101777) TaxID=1042311 RepID=A0A2T3ZCA7_TRIA4|nr:hypothetical protein M441DRAFT_46108 [Trichoderma asperellum CBS 433.97]PTB42429.1 hypothetical protein M441DRAFT_46108 [Trichoderma asperellum CBS 433.97]
MVITKPNNAFSAFFSSGHADFLALLLTTPISTLLLYWSLNNTVFSGSLLRIIESNRPTVQFAVQLIANLLSLCQILVLCRLINYGIRIRLARNAMKLNSVRAWIDAMQPRINFSLPIRFLLPLSAFVALTMILSALWAAALTPVQLSQDVDQTIIVPSWDNVSLVKEYPSEVGKEGATVQNLKGRFSYSVGNQLLGSLLASASSATTIDGSPRIHEKLDKSKFTYIGRSYGIGSSVGLADEGILDNNLALGYAFQETGYNADVNCIYNASSQFSLSPTVDSLIYAASGPLPDSDNGPEYSDYIGHNMDRIVSVGVAHFANESADVYPLRKYLAFATGSNYDFLNKIQCDINFVPTRFNVTVDFQGQNITIKAINDTKIQDINPSRRLKSTVMRQFELIANDETNLYISTVGSAFNASITDFRTYIHSSAAVENSITAMADDMLGAYASAQLMVGDLTQGINATVQLTAIAFGGIKYNIAIFAVNIAVIMLLLIEVIRTRGWKGLPDFDVADIRHLIIAASEGGKELGNIAFGQENDIRDVPIRYTKLMGDRFAIVANEEAEGAFMIQHKGLVISTKSSVTEFDNII